MRTLSQGVTLARYIAERKQYFNLAGIEGFEGALPGDPKLATNAIAVFLDRVAELAKCCDDERLFSGPHLLLTAGGSTFFSRVAKSLGSVQLSRKPTVLLRSGCYLTHDHGVYADLAGFEGGYQDVTYPKLTPALEVWASVQSVPEPGLAILALGKRDISYDIHLPRPISCVDAQGLRSVGAGEFEIVALNDQHAYMRCEPGHEPAVGDLIGLGISHPCTTFDKWQLVFIVDDEYNVIEGVRTFF